MGALSAFFDLDYITYNGISLWVSIVIFIWVNVHILWEDIRFRRISNKKFLWLGVILLGSLIITGYHPSYQKMFILILCASLVWLLGIFLYTENGIIGAGDIKYFSLLLLFLGNTPLGLFLGNISVLTIILLIGWIGFIGGRVLGSYKDIAQMLKITKKRIQENYKMTLIIWGYIGFFLATCLEFFWEAAGSLLWDTPPTIRQEYYLLIGIGLFLAQGYARKFLLWSKEYHIPLFTFSLLFLTHQYETLIHIKYGEYLKNFWMFGLSIFLIQHLFHGLFHLHDKRNGAIKQNGFPYSIVIFIGFCISVSGINLIQVLLK